MRYRISWRPCDRCFVIIANGTGVIVARADDRAEAEAVVEAFREADAEQAAVRRRQAKVAREARLRLTAARVAAAG